MIQKYWIYQVWNSAGTYLGCLQDVKNDFVLNLDINSAGPSPIEIQVAQTADTTQLPVKAILSEDGKWLVTEDGKGLTTEGEPSNYAISGSKVKNGNTIKITEVSSYHPTGLLVYTGRVKKWKINMGTDEYMSIFVTPLSQDLNGHLVKSDPVLQASQTAYTTAFSIYDGLGGRRYLYHYWFYGLAGSMTNLSSLKLLLSAISGATPATVTVTISRAFSDTETVDLGAALDRSGNASYTVGSASAVVTGTSAQEYEFTFDIPLVLDQHYVYGILVTCSGGSSVGANVYFTDSDIVASANQWSNLNDGTGWKIGVPPGYVYTGDMYFKFYTIPPYTKATLTNFDPSTLLRTILGNYISEGGAVTYSPSSINTTGEVVPQYTFSVNTVLEGIETMLDFAPRDWYYTINPGTNLLTFKHSNTGTADHVLVFKRDINNLDLSASVENVKNDIFLTGGDIGGGINLFKESLNQSSKNSFGVSIDRLSDPRITNSSTGQARANTYLDKNDDEVFETSVTIIDGVEDITIYNPGETIGFMGFGSLADTVILPIVRISRYGDRVELFLGVLPFRQSTQINETEDKLLGLQTIANPNQPS